MFFDIKFDMLSDVDFILRFSKKYNFECVNYPIATYRIHNDQLQSKNFHTSGSIFQNGIQSLNQHKSLVQKKIKYYQKKSIIFKTLSLIYKKKYYESLKNIFFYPNNLDKLKLLLFCDTKLSFKKNN